MKFIAALLLVIFVSTSMTPSPVSKKLKSYSWFCVSQAMPENASKRMLEMHQKFGGSGQKFELPPADRIQREGSSKQVVFITRLMDTVIAESEFAKLTKGWASWVNEKCVNQFGCTSDLLYYEDPKQAITEFDKTMKMYADGNKYEIRLSNY